MKKNFFFPIFFLALFLPIITGCTSKKQTITSNTTTTASQTEQLQLTTFEDTQVRARALSDWEGSWKSIYPYLKSGALDPVFKEKVKKSSDKNFEEYKEYYRIGYKTTTEKIDIYKDKISFYTDNRWQNGSYQYIGYKILTYKSGSKGVRYLFSKIAGDELAPTSVQFSDHLIQPEKSAHFHLFFGNQTHDELLKEMDNWPTYFPSSYSESNIVHDLLHH